MASLDPVADRVVRDAVDAFIDGRLAPDFSGETVFETKNSRYRLLDGVVFSAPDNSLLGAELVGWLMETPRSVVESAWAPGSRAVLVDRARGRSIIVTSTTRLLHLEDSGSDAYHPGSASPHPAYVVPPYGTGSAPQHPPYPPPSPIPPAALRPSPLPPPFAPRSAPIIPSTPPPPFVALPSPLPPPPAYIATKPSPVFEPIFAATQSTVSQPAPVAPVTSAATAVASPIPSPKRAPAVHLPPRPIAARAATPSPLPPAPVELRPLPAPTPPPRPSAAPHVNGAHASDVHSGDAEWELTSSELELDPDESDTNEVETWRHPSTHASRHGGEGADSIDEPDSSGAPIPLIRAIPPAPAPRPPPRPAPRRSGR